MAVQVLTNVKVWANGLDLSGVSNSVTFEVSADMQESTTFGDEYRTRAEGGLKSTTFSLEGFFESDEVDETQFDALGDDATFAIAPAGTSGGEVAYIVPQVISGYSLSGSVGELLAYTFAGEGDGVAERMTVVDVRSSVTADVSTPLRQLGAVPAGQTLRVYVHAKQNALSLTIGLYSTATTPITHQGAYDALVAYSAGDAVRWTDGLVYVASADTTAGTEPPAAPWGLVMQRATATVSATGVTVLTVNGPVTDEYWYLEYDLGAGADFDLAAFAAVI